MVVTFHSDLPIHVIYKKVLSKLENILEKKEEYLDEYNRCHKIAECSHNPEDRQAAHSKYLKMERIVKYVEDDTLLDVYKSKVLPIVKEYLDVQGGKYVFGSTSKTDTPRRVAIIVRFMNIVNEFVSLEWECSFNMDDVCPKCYAYTENRSNINVCTKCKSVYSVDSSKSSSSDPNDSTKESTYKSGKNYKKEFLHLCGLQNSCESNEIKDIESYLYRSGIKKISRSDIRTAITRCGYKNYNDINYIYSEIAKEPLPPISDYMSVCNDRFEKYYVEFDKRHPDDNVTSLHFLTRLFLYEEGIHTEEDWFRQLSSKTRKRHMRNAIDTLSVLKEKYPHQNWSYPPEWDDELCD